MIDAPLALGYTAGLLAAFNPCGFAMLPAYLGFFSSVDDRDRASTATAVARALRAAVAVSLGFAAVFAVAGLLVTQASVTVSRFVPWLTIAIGLALIPLGVMVARGFKLVIRVPVLQHGGSSRGMGSMIAFGASYGTVSLTCTLPVFLAAVSTTFGSAGIISGFAVFVAYALGMATVITILSVGLALARGRLIARMRRGVRYVNVAGGALLALTGVYVAYYGYFDLAIIAGRDVNTAPVDAVSSISGAVSSWVSSTGAVRLGVIALVVIVAVVAVVRWRAPNETASADPADARAR